MTRFLYIALLFAGMSHALVCPTNVFFEKNDSLSRWVAHTINFKAKSCPALSIDIDTVYFFMNISKDIKIDSLKPAKGMNLEEYADLYEKYWKDTTKSLAYIKNKYPIRDGKINGLSSSVFFMPNGTKFLSKIQFKDGKREGLSQAYIHENDSITPYGEDSYSNDLLDGESIIYKDPLFMGKEVTKYSKGEIISETQFFPNGNVRYKMPYKNGKRHGQYEQYTEDGKLEIVQEFVNDKKHGKTTCYILDFEEGTEEQIWKNDKLTHIYHYYADGQLKYSQEYPRGKYKEFYRSGEIRFISFYKDSIMHGDLTNYTHTFLDGKSTEYYPSGKIKAETNYKKGLKHGKHIEYYPCYERNCKQKKILEENYNDGKRHGLFIEYNIDGSIISKAKYENNDLVGTKVCRDGRQGNSKLDCKNTNSD